MKTAFKRAKLRVGIDVARLEELGSSKVRYAQRIWEGLKSQLNFHIAALFSSDPKGHMLSSKDIDFFQLHQLIACAQFHKEGFDCSQSCAAL